MGRTKKVVETKEYEVKDEDNKVEVEVTTEEKEVEVEEVIEVKDETLYFEKKKVVKVLGEKVVGGRTYKTVQCEDGCTYDMEV